MESHDSTSLPYELIKKKGNVDTVCRPTAESIAEQIWEASMYGVVDSPEPWVAPSLEECVEIEHSVLALRRLAEEPLGSADLDLRATEISRHSKLVQRCEMMVRPMIPFQSAMEAFELDHFQSLGGMAGIGPSKHDYLGLHCKPLRASTSPRGGVLLTLCASRWGGRIEHAMFTLPVVIPKEGGQYSPLHCVAVRRMLSARMDGWVTTEDTIFRADSLYLQCLSLQD
ncbi:hypothetical protein [Xanthomonas euvesicatoria]|uniref:hypothetical protein n=1 Tax=Xanthomonas euvesicatoria TaxID=456327 RepID=UPI0013DF736F|nr:hypothetical protein [Xanthomonas euvesicatoria]